MSGEKHCTIAESELRRLRKAAERLRIIQDDLPELMMEVRRQTQADLRQGIRSVEDRQRKFNKVLDKLSDAAREQERRTSARLAAQAKAMSDAVDILDSRISDHIDWTEGAIAHTRQLLLDQEDRLHQEINAEREERQRHFDAIGLRIEDLEDSIEDTAERLDDLISELAEERDREAEFAREWIHNADALRASIRDELPHERFAPNRLATVEARLGTAASTYTRGRYEAAAAGAQVAYHEFSDLRMEVELRSREWQFARTRALEALTILDRLVEDNRRRQAIDGEGNVLPDHELDVNLWSNGQLSIVSDQIDELLARVSPEDSALTTAELRKLEEETAPELEARLQDIIADAAYQNLLSQTRATIAQVIADILQTEGFDPVENSDSESGYEFVWAGNDMRDALVGRLESFDGSQVVIVVTREGRIEVNSFDADTDPVTAEPIRNDRAKAITAAIREVGVSVSALEEERSTPNDDVRDVVRIQREGMPERYGTVGDAVRPHAARG